MNQGSKSLGGEAHSEIDGGFRFRHFVSGFLDSPMRQLITNVWLRKII